MNREIKFRAWDNVNNQMLDVQELNFEDCFYGGYTTVRTTMYSDYFDIREMPIMQYTGLHDKNGKEIYEGDILKGTFYGFPIPEYDYVFQIYWDEKEKGFMASYFEPSECEVIGNIYNNPELLGGTNGI